MVRSLLKAIESQGRHGAALAFALLLGWYSAGLMPTPTPYGIQCPTAKVQTVRVPVICCNKIKGYVDRAPRPGEAGFRQCRCAEKQSAEHQAAWSQSAERLEFVPATRFEFDLSPATLAAPSVDHSPVLPIERSEAPPVPPPSLA